MTATQKIDTKPGASFIRTKKVASLGLMATLMGGALMAAPAAQAAEGIGWVPAPSKSVVGSIAEAGSNGHKSIADLGVFPGQKAEYVIGVDLDTGAGAEAVTTLSVVDKLASGFTVDQNSITVVDQSKKLVAVSDYKVVLVDGSLSVSFKDSWIADNVGASAANVTTKLLITFTGTVSPTADAYSSQGDIATQIVNGESFDTAPAIVLVPGVDPIETVASTDGVAVGDRVAVGGDTLNYSVALDGTFGQDVVTQVETPDGFGGTTTKEVVTATALDLAYDVTKFGIVDDFDEKSVTIAANSVKVLNAAGQDVTRDFTVSTAGGVLSVLAKATGARGSVPASVLGKDYTVSYVAVVRDVTADVTLVGNANEVINDKTHPVSAEGNVNVKAAAPSKSAVTRAIAGTDAIPGTVPANGNPGTEEVPAVPAIPEAALDTIAKNGEFSYKLGSSELPANRLSPLKSWTVADAYTKGDRALHDSWSVVASTDILGADGVVLFATGAVIADQDNKEYFTAAFGGDAVSVAATPSFLEAVNTNLDSAASWAVYVEAIRTAAVDTKVSNTSSENSNGFVRQATVTTGTSAAVVVDPVEPTEPPVEPTEPPVDPTEPTVKPTDPTVEPTDKPVDPTVKPTDPSVEPTDKPVDPTQKPVDPTIKPTDPTVKPTDPANPGVVKTEGSITIESYVITKDGEKTEKINADTAADAYVIDPAKAGEPVTIRYEVTNNGKTALKDVAVLVTEQENSTGVISDVVRENHAGLIKNTLEVGGTTSFEGTLTGVVPGNGHFDIAKVQAVVVETVPGTDGIDKNAVSLVPEDATKKGTPVLVTDSDELHLSLASGIKPLGDVTKGGDKGEVVTGDKDNKMGAVTGEAVSSTNPVMVGGGIAALLAAIGGGFALMFRRRNAAEAELSEK